MPHEWTGPLRPGGGLLARRATEVIVAACRLAGCQRVLVPALYCPEVVAAIQAAVGAQVNYYDVHPDLSPPADQVAAALAAGAGLVIWHHPFGSYSPRSSWPGATVVDDACFTLRTALAMDQLPDHDLMVFSPRKELGWKHGGLAIGRRVPEMSAAVTAADDEVLSRWRSDDLGREVDSGMAATAYARQELGERLPALAAATPVLTLLPLLSSRRDAVIDTLRAERVLAWCWQQRLPGCSPRQAPHAWALWGRLLLVPLPPMGSAIYRLLASQDLLSWGSGR